MRIELQQVCANYLDHSVLTDIDLTVGGAERLVLLGANGSGKTTLLRLLSGAHEPASGTLLVDGTALKHDRKGLREHRRRVQLVLQDPDDQLFSADVAADISFGPLNLGLPEDEVRARVEEALELLHISHLRNRPTHQLSYGEKKRAAIAGAVAMRPELLLLDEPTSGLDPSGCDELLDTLNGLEAHGTSLVMSTHDVGLALAWADRAVVVTGGSVTPGDPALLLADLELLARARLHRPWPLELAFRLAERGLVPPGLRPRNLDQVLHAIEEGTL